MEAVISNQTVPFDEYEHDLAEATPFDPNEDDSSTYSVFQSFFNSPEPQNPPKILSPNQV